MPQDTGARAAIQFARWRARHSGEKFQNIASHSSQKNSEIIVGEDCFFLGKNDENIKGMKLEPNFPFTVIPLTEPKLCATVDSILVID